MRVRLRATPTPAELATMYAVPHDHTRWADHVLRVDVTTVMAASVLKPGASIADLSCGDATVARRLATIRETQLPILGDIAPGYDHHGPIEETVNQIPKVDMFLLCETLEHLDDPDKVLAMVREKTDTLVLSTPDGEANQDNPEHVWGWDADGVESMLVTAGFTPLVLTSLDLRPAGNVYCFQIWVCR